MPQTALLRQLPRLTRLGLADGGWGARIAERLCDALLALDVSGSMGWSATGLSLKNGGEVDTFQVYTDNETWWGAIHPHQALREYRERTGIAARLAVVALTSTRTTIADPADPGQLDVSGFDAAVPTLLADFSRGDV